MEGWHRNFGQEIRAGQGDTSYPAGLEVAPNGKFIYVGENVGDRLAVVDTATGEIVQRFPTDHYPYGVIFSADGHLFVSAWGGTTVSDFRVLTDGRLAYVGRIEVGRHPSALAATGSRFYVALAGSDRVAIVDTRFRTVIGYLHDSAPGAPPEGSTPNLEQCPRVCRRTRYLEPHRGQRKRRHH